MSRAVLPNEHSTLIVEAHGPLPMTVRYATAGGPADSPHVVVRSPDTLVYAMDAQAVAAVTYSLLLARARAGRALPREYEPSEQSYHRSVVASVTLRGDRRIGEPRALCESSSPNGTAHVVLRLDGLTVRFYDQAALDAYTRAWAEAHRCAELAFGLGKAPSLPTLMHRAAQQARTPYLLDGLAHNERQLPGSATRIEGSSQMRGL
jgi:hypothetical protein